MPGYIEKVAKGLIKDLPDCTLSYYPAFVAQGNVINGFLQPDMVASQSHIKMDIYLISLQVLIGEGAKEAGDALERLARSVCLNTPVICRVTSAR